MLKLALLIVVCSVGTTLTADDYLKNAEWKARVDSIFDALDLNKDGLITVDDVVFDTRKYAHLNSDPNLIERYRIARCEFVAEIGIKPGISLTKEEHVHNVANLAPREVAKVRSGEGSLLHKLSNALYDLIDTNHDGFVSREEYRAFLEAVGGERSPAYIDTVFDLIDTNKDGKLERKELSDYEFRLFFTLEDVTGKAQVDAELKVVKAKEA